MPKQLNAGRVTATLQRAFGFKGRYTPMLDEVIVPVYVISDPAPAEITQLCAGTTSASEVLGDMNLLAVMLFNPEESGVICNVTTVSVIGNQKSNVNVVFSDFALIDPSGPATFRDRRVVGTPRCQLRRDQTRLTPLTGTIIAQFQIDGALAQSAAWLADAGDPRQPLTVLRPNQGLALQLNTATGTPGDNLRGNFRWLEIPITEQRPPGGLP